MYGLVLKQRSLILKRQSISRDTSVLDASGILCPAAPKLNISGTLQSLLQCCAISKKAPTLSSSDCRYLYWY